MRPANRPFQTRPWWVKLGLWKVPNRAVAMFCMWISIAFATSFLVTGAYGWCAYGIFAAIWYWKSIDWVDKNDRW
jgi:hypothetical protein